MIRSLAEGHTVLLSTHILPEVVMTCSRAVVIHRGRIAAEDTLQNIQAAGGLEEMFLRVTAGETDDEPAGGEAGGSI
jgi:ABC-2 type transport system ATP-binding protein